MALFLGNVFNKVFHDSHLRNVMTECLFGDIGLTLGKCSIQVLIDLLKLWLQASYVVRRKQRGYPLFEEFATACNHQAARLQCGAILVHAAPV